MKTIFGLILAVAAIQFTVPASAATTDAKDIYKAANDKAASDYKLARKQCDSITGNAKDVCVAQAKAAKVESESYATAEYKGTPAARVSASNDIADANYDVDKTKCESQNGNPKDVCIKQAQATMVAAKANATANKKIGEAQADANDDKQAANYKVAMQKCDALAGSSKDNCVTSVKSQFGK